MSFRRPRTEKSWPWPGSTKAARMIFKLLDIKPSQMKSKSKGELRLLGEMRAGMLEVVAYRNEPNMLGLQMRTSSYRDRGGALLRGCKSILYVPENDRQSSIERRVEILCRNGQASVNGWGIHTTIDPIEEHRAET